MKINCINGSNPQFGHISTQAINAVRSHAEGYRVNNKTKNAFYNTNPKYQLMDDEELKRLENLAMKASLLDNSWIHCKADGNLIVEFYKNCNPSQVCRFDADKEGDISTALDTLESAVYLAETGEYATIDENEDSSPVWKQEITDANYIFDRFRSQKDNKTLKRIYDKTFEIKN